MNIKDHLQIETLPHTGELLVKIKTSVPVRILRVKREISDDFIKALNGDCVNSQLNLFITKQIIPYLNYCKPEFNKFYIFRNIDFFLNQIYRHFKALPVVFIIISIFTWFFLVYALFTRSISVHGLPEIRIWMIPVLYLFLWFGVIFHELAHAITAKYSGGKVEYIGYRFNLIPFGLCDMSSTEQMTNKYKRAFCFFSGILFWLELCKLLFITFLFCCDQSTQTLTLYAAFLSLVSAIFVSNPYIRSDLILTFESLYKKKVLS
jgi:hypothetical protein